MHAKQVVESDANENYHISHSVRSSIIALIIGIYLKLPKHRLIEVGVAALVRDISILKLPPDIYLNGGTTEQERRLMAVHPIHAYKIIKGFNFPLSICEAVLQHHEREDGSGYPQKLTGDRIGVYGKIIAVACSYEAFSTKHVDEAKCGHMGMMTLLKNEGNQFDETVVRALVYSLSIYPVGTYVLLSDGRQGQVVDADPENPRYPIVHVHGEPLPGETDNTLKTSPKGVSIVRTLTRKEVVVST
jgi:HD-GYP domain-containing protein (c-di-GMP phosphodiesterase class II)